MKRCTMLALMMMLVLSFQKVTGIYAAPLKGGKGNSQSPYFFVQGNTKVDSFPLLKTNADVNISGISSEIKLTQVYKNNGKKTIEAIYVFPLGTHAAIHAMRMKIADRTVEANIEETAKAQKIYQTAKNEGKVASLLEQQRPNVFQMKVANIMPGDIVEVLVQYTEILVPENGTYEFIFPTVVGPRYTGNKKDAQNTKNNWTETPYLHEGKEPAYNFGISVNLKTGIPYSKVWSPSHKVNINETAADEAHVTLASKKGKSGNKDFILRYNLQGNAIHTGLLLYPGQKEKFFLLMLEPPKNVDAAMVPPREYVFILDVSGSMDGFPLEISKTLIKNIVGNLREKDYFNILFFAGGSDVLSPYPLQATVKNKKKAISMVMSQNGGGGTEILDALKRALSLKKKKGLSRIIVTATDGYVDVEKEAFDLIRNNLNQANFFAFGIGSSVNRYLIEGMARAGKGEPFVATNQKEAEDAADKFIEYVKHPLLTDINVSFDGFDAYEIEPPSMPDLFAKRPLVLFGKYKNASGKIKVSGKTASGSYEKVVTVSAAMEEKNNEALKYLWAREKIARLSDYGKLGVSVAKDVTALGLKYHLMTEYTSFVAVDKIVRKTGEAVTVKQPLPLPEGVSDLAVEGGYMGNSYKSLGTVNAPTMTTALPAKDEEADELDAKEKIKSAPQIYVSGGTLPSGMSLDAVEKTILSQLKKELEDTFSKWNLTRVTVSLKVEKGKVTELKIKKYEGKECKADVLEKLFQKLKFSASSSGTWELTLEYM